MVWAALNFEFVADDSNTYAWEVVVNPNGTELSGRNEVCVSQARFTKYIYGDFAGPLGYLTGHV